MLASFNPPNLRIVLLVNRPPRQTKPNNTGNRLFSKQNTNVIT